MGESAQRVTYEFDRFQVDPGQRLLRSRVDGEPLPLTAKAFDTLLYLVEHRGELVEKRTLMKAVWPNVVVEENNLNQSISALRRVLGEQAGEHRYIVTEAGRGYRFVAPVETVSTTAVAGVTASHRLRIAILPFENLSPDPNDAYFTDGLHEEILSTLARRAPGLEVVSRTTMMGYRLHPKPVQEVAQELAATHVIEGSVRRDQNTVRLTVQLIDARRDRHLWSRNYDRALREVLTLQSDVATEVASQLSVQLSGTAQSAAPPTQNPEAYDLYLKALVARQFVTPFAPIERYRDVDDLLARAIVLDPSFAAAYAQRATFRGAMYAFNYDVSEEHVRRIREDMDAGLRLAPDDPFVLAAEALHWSWVERDLPRALTTYEASEAAGLTDSMFLTGKAGILLRMGQVAESSRLLERLLALDPGNPFIIVGTAMTLAYQRRPADALRALDRALEMFPGNPTLSSARAQVIFAYTGRSDEWRALLDRGDLEATRNAFLDQHFDLLRIEHRYAELQKLLDEVSETSIRVIAGPAAGGFYGAGDRPTAEYRGWTSLLLGDRPAAARHGHAVLEFVANAPETTRNAWFLRLLKAQGHTFLAQPALAIVAAHAALELMPPSRDALTRLTMTARTAAIYAWSGAEDDAVGLLEELSAAIPGVGPGQLARDPLFGVPLERNHRFLALVQRLEEKMRTTEL